MGTKHTPGPWFEARRSQCTVLKDIYINGGGERIARVVVPHTAYNIEEYEANARLIAAAPELLEALQILVNTFGPTASENFVGLAQARAAIAKATGATT